MVYQSEYTPRLRDRVADEAKETLDQVGKIRIPDFILGALMVMIGFSLPGGVPVSVAATAIFVVICLSRKSYFKSNKVNIFIFFIILAVIFTTVFSLQYSSSSNLQVLQRAMKLLSVIMLVYVISERRADHKSVVLGMATFLLLNVPVFYLGLNSNTYGGYLTGWIADKNQSGFWYAVVGFMLVSFLSKKWHKILAILVFCGIIFLTGSRTSFAAFAFALIWLVIAPKLNVIAKLGLAATIIWAVDYITINFSQNSIFGDRTGTDALRERIDEASLEKLHSAPWHGLGYGQATVELGGNSTFFFHNSFWTLIVEGGYPYMLMVVSLTIIAALLWQQPLEKQGLKRNVAGEAALVLVFICSWRLGEVLLTVPWALSMGLVLTQLVIPITGPHYKMGVKV